VDFDRLIGFLDAKLFDHTQRHLRDVEVFILKGSYADKTYEEIALEHSYTPLYLGRDIGPKLWKLLTAVFAEPVNKKNFRSVLERHFIQFVDKTQGAPPIQYQRSEMPPVIEPAKLTSSQPFNWEQTIDVSIFYGRQDELSTLEHWIVQEQCRLVALLGMGGIGKTTLAVKFAEQMHDAFEVVIWRSLRNAPTIEETFAEWTQRLFHTEDLPPLSTLEHKISHLIHYLRQYRCLLILDNFESILQGGAQPGVYLPGYEGYGMLLRYVAEVKHQSCVLLTGREKPTGIAQHEGPALPVRSLSVKGLKAADIQAIFSDKGCMGLEEIHIQPLLEHYAGNPLALKIVAAALYELGGGNANELVPYLKRGIFNFDDINDLLARHFNRLSGPERKVMYWLAINRAPVIIAQLHTDSLATPMQELLDAIQALNRRSLIERDGNQWFLQPVVQEYVTQRLTSSISEELLGGEWVMLRQYALTKAQSLDYIQAAQRQFIVQPVIDCLQAELGSSQAAIDHLRSRLSEFKAAHANQIGYVAGNLVNLLRALQADLSHLDLSHLTVWQADFRQVALHSVNLSHCDVSTSAFTPVLNATLAVAFSPDGLYFASGNADNYLRLWRVEDCKELLIGKGHQSWVSAAAFSPDGKLLASGSFDHTIRLWQVKTGECMGLLQGHQGWIWSLAFSPDGQTLLSGSDDCTVKVWDVATASCRQTLKEHQGWVWSVTFSPDGQTMATAGNDQIIRLWNSATGELCKRLVGHEGWVRTIRFDSSGQQLISGGDDTTLRIWDVATGDCLQVLSGHRRAIMSVAYAPPLDTAQAGTLATAMDGAIIVSGSQDCTVRIWDAVTGQCLRVLSAVKTRIWSVALHPGGRLLLSGSNDSTLRLWNPRTGQPLRTLPASCIGLKGIAYSPDGRVLASGGDDQIIRLWDVASGKQFLSLEEHQGWIWNFAFTPDGQQLASASGDGTLKLWDLRTSQCRRTFLGHQNIVFAVAIDSRGRWLASGSNDQTAKLWDVTTGECRYTWQHQSQIWSVAFHPTSPYLLTSGDRQGMKLWDVQSGELVRRFGASEAMVHAACFSADGQWLASGRDDNWVEVWDGQGNTCHHRFNHESRVWSVAFSPDHRYLASAGFDHTVKIWNMATVDCIHTLRGHEGEVWSVAFHPQTLELASGSQDGQVRLWDVLTGTTTQTLREARLYENLCISGTTGLSTAQRQSLQMLGAVTTEDNIGNNTQGMI
jgi:WD40 repeat protein